MTRNARRGLFAALMACGLVAPSWAAVPPQTPLAEKVLRHPDLHIPTRLQPAADLTGALGAKIHEDLAALAVSGEHAFYDARAGRLTSFMLSEPLIPGTGVGNELRWPSGVSPRDEDAVKEIVWSALRGYLQDRQGILGVNPAELGEPRITVVEDAAIVQVHVPRVLGGVAVRDSNVTAVLNHGNLVLLGLDHWADAAAGDGAAIGETQAQFRVKQHVAPFEIESMARGRLEYIPMVKGEGYDYRLAWVVPVAVVDDLGSWEGLVDAANGELIAFEDRNQYARKVIGGVYPVSNDQRPPDGVEQIGWPMPFANIGGGLFTNQAGTVACSVAGPMNTTLNGQFVRIQDNCGAVNETAPNDLDLGFGPTATATDCAVPAGHSAGDTKSARSGFYELNRIKEQARGYLPANTWLQGVLPSNMNINNSCNAFWSTGAGTVNFYRSSATCRNTGEIAAIFDHEWGHGMDANGTAGGVSNPGEGIADIHGFLRLSDSCIGRGFWINQTCGGYGDACDGTPATGCTGIRDIDFMGRRCNAPHTVTYITQGFTSAQCGGTGAAPACPGSGGPCGRAVHCEGAVVAESAFDLARRDFPAAPYNFDSNTAHELSTRLWTIGAGPVTSWYTCSVGGGCAATGGYLNILAVDDDNGNLTDGTPHMSAIRTAFQRHEIHCATPAVVDSGCAGGPTTAPVLTATAGTEQVGLSWTAVSGASRYYVYRTEGVFGCNFGKIKIGDVTGTTFTDTGLLSGRGYSYVVLPVGASTSCFGRASNCGQATPAAATPCAPTADFTLSCAPAAITAGQGGSGTSTCTVQSLAGFSSAVTLGCVGLPANVTCSYNPGSVTPAPNGSTTSDLTVNVGATVAPGNYTFTATGQSGLITHTFGMSLTVVAISVAPEALTVDAAGNGVLQPNEGQIVMAPTWRNTSITPVTLTGTTTSFTGPSGPLYANGDSSASYGSIAVNGQAICTDCYTVGITAGIRPTVHWDSTIRETVTPTSTQKTWTLHVGNSFTDVPPTSPFFRFIETIIHKNVTGGCTTTTYCPVASTTREQMAVFVLVSKEAPGYTPPACVAGSEQFADVPASSPFCRWIEELATRGVVSGCGGGAYCPTASATREQMAVFVLRTLDPALNPPACVAGSEQFADVPASSGFCRWIEELANRGVVTGCGGGNYCPTADVSREQMSVFLAVTFGLTLYGL
jgi:hypothetical protein